ncbi:MAG: Gfo/Idh/MocA family oxidoreductase [Fibrobacteres bacterium]|nr:Gfo/Idh/MocA family oxidoreductase [Fibrobacterota bacterium]
MWGAVMDKVKLGFIGTGGMGQMAHLRNYAVIENCEIAAIAELREKIGKGVAARYSIPKVYKDHIEMLQKEKLDGIVASQPFSVHASLVPEIFKHVKHVFTEKPIAVSVEAGEKLVEAAKASGSIHMVGYHKHSDPATVYAKTVIDEWKSTGKMGAFKYVRITMPSGDWIAGGFDGLIKSDDLYPQVIKESAPADMDEATGKAYVSFVNYYIHQVNLMRHLLGESYSLKYAEKSGILLAVESVSGIPGIIEMTPYRTTIEWQEEILIAFEKGYITLKLPAPMTINRAGSVDVYEDPGEGKTPMRYSPVLPWIHAMKAQAMNFVKVCKGEIAPPCDGVEAVEDLKIARDYIRMVASSSLGK